MNVVDSSCWMEYFVDSPQAREFVKPIEDLEHLAVPTITILDIFRKFLGADDPAGARRATALMRRGHVIPLDERIAVEAALLGKALRLPLAASIILATARGTGSTFWTQDAHFEGIPGVRYFPKTG